MRQRGAERDALLLASRELAREGVGTIEQPDPLQELAGSDQRRVGWNGGEPEREGDELRRGELTLERAPVVLVRVPEHVPAIPPSSRADAFGTSTPATTSAPADGRARPARMRMKVVFPDPLGPSTTQISPSSTLSVSPCKRGDSACGGRVDGEQFAGVDKRGHSVGLPVRGPRSPANARRVAPPTRRAATIAKSTTPGDDERRIDDHGERRLGIRSACSDGDDAGDEEQEREARREPSDETDG